MSGAAKSWVEAERVSGQRVDRRLTYTIADGAACVDVRHTSACSGCDTGGEYSDAKRGSGCDVCGFTGRRRHVDAVPLRVTP